jgi:hypothetical protein
VANNSLGCCDKRQELIIKNNAATSEITHVLSIRWSKLIGNQFGLHLVYIISCISLKKNSLLSELQQVMSPRANHSGAVCARSETILSILKYISAVLYTPHYCGA